MNYLHRKKDDWRWIESGNKDKLEEGGERAIDTQIVDRGRKQTKQTQLATPVTRVIAVEC